MDVSSALCHLDQMIYKPGWTFEASDLTDRFEGTIALRVHYPARNYNRDQAPDYPQEITPSAVFPLVVGDCEDVHRLYRKVHGVIMRIEDHEAREALRHPDGLGGWEAPFHPHRLDTMARWAELTGGDVEADFMFGAL